MNRVRLAFCVLLFCGFPLTGTAQEERANPVVTAAVPVDKIRFAGSPSSVQMRIEVRSAGGAVVHDSDWKDGNILDWLPRDSSGHPLPYGAYRLEMMSKNLAGQTSETEAALHVDSGGMVVEDQPSASPKITLTAHDGETGQLITTSGDLSFRFGDFLNRKDTEAMRLSGAGELNVIGLVHAKGVMFPDGTVLTTAGGTAAAAPGAGAVPNRPAPGSSIIVGGLDALKPLPGATASHLKPTPNFAPAYQFVVGDAGVSIGTTNPAYRLDVNGEVNTLSGYDVGGNRIVSSDASGDISVGLYSGSGGGGSSSFFGTQAGYQTSGSGNSFFGYQSGYSNTAGIDNAFFGLFAGLFTNANEDSFFGANAGLQSTTGGANTAVGYEALYSNTTGGNNVALGAFAGYNLTTGFRNIDIDNQGVAGDVGTIRIGNSGAQSRAFIQGIIGVTTALTAVPVLIDSNGQLGTVSSSRRYKFDIASMGDATDGLMHLRPVTFRYLAHGDNAPLQYGLIAEEVAEVYPELVARNKDGEVETVMYQFLAPMLLNEVQKQQRQIEGQQKTIDALNTTLERLMQRVEELERKRTASE